MSKLPLTRGGEARRKEEEKLAELTNVNNSLKLLGQGGGINSHFPNGDSDGKVGGSVREE